MSPQIAGTAGLNDTAITTKVKAAFMTDEQLKETKISVETTHGTVELGGTVNSRDQETEAVNVASKVNGVRAVKDKLAVQGMESPSRTSY